MRSETQHGKNVGWWQFYRWMFLFVSFM